MREEIAAAINRAYVEKHSPDTGESRTITEAQIRAIISEIIASCAVNVTYSADTNYATCYQLTITDKDIPTPQEFIQKGFNPEQLPEVYYVLLINISWLAPFAMGFWNMYRKNRDPIYLLESSEDHEREKQNCVYRLLRQHGIQMLSEEELEEEILFLDITLLDDAKPNVRHLLFAEYI